MTETIRIDCNHRRSASKDLQSTRVVPVLLSAGFANCGVAKSHSGRSSCFVNVVFIAVAFFAVVLNSVVLVGFWPPFGWP